MLTPTNLISSFGFLTYNFRSLTQWGSFALWIISHVLLIFCLIGLARHSRFRNVPFFFTYLVFEEFVFATALTITLLTLHWRQLNVVYQWVEIVGSVGISSCLQFAVFYEVVSILILPRSVALTALRPLIRWVIVIGILLGVLISATFSGAQLRPLTHAFAVLNFSTNLVNLSLLIMLFIFTRTLHILWSSLPAGVALGFAITSSTEMGAIAFVSAFGTRGIIFSDLVRMLGFFVCTSVWLVYIFLPTAQPSAGQGLRQHEIEIWERELLGLAKQ